MEKRILFLDLDGTLLDDQKQIPQKNKEVLQKAAEQGHHVVIATGRALSSAQTLMRKLGFDRAGFYCIAYNGGILYDCGKEQVLSEHTLPLEVVMHIAREAEKKGLFCQTYQGADILAPRDCEELQYYVKRTSMSYRITDDFRKELKGNPHKALIVSLKGRQELENFRQELLPWAQGKVEMIFSCDQYLEFLPLEVEKGNAVRELCRVLSMPIESSIAVGDEENDRSMIRAAGLGCAMANGIPSIKKEAGYVTERDNNHCGVAEVVEKFMLGQQ